MTEEQHYLGHRQRLRERFLLASGDDLPDYELLELILFAAKPRGDVKPLAKRLLKIFGTFDKLIYASEAELRKVDEVGDAVISSLKTIRVASARLLKSSIEDKPIIQSWTALMDYCRLSMGKEKIEQFRVLFLNNRHALIADEVMQEGTVNHTPVYPREIIKRALELHASAIILLHNHPSGDPSPSKADIDMTKKIVEAAKTVGIEVHDHVIITENGHYSFKSFGLI
ncbi:MAG: DNA repair protein RadC [Alphaproteobacteria bacterium]|nr:DNA repair protein RadC [Alphaproteobacteria bacterium]